MTPPFTLPQVAALVGGEAGLAGEQRFTGIAPLHAATSSDVTWVAHPKHRQALASSRAGAVLVDKRFGASPIPAVVCPNVERAVAQLLEAFGPPVPRPAPGIHPTACVAPDAMLGEDVSVGPHVVIESRATIGARSILQAGVLIGQDCVVGEDCRLWPHVVVRERCRLGNRVIIHPGAVVGADGFGYFFDAGRHQKVPHPGIVVIGNDVEIGANACIDRSKSGATVIGDGVKIDNLVQIAHNVEIGANSLICAQVGIAGSARLGRMVVLGGQVGIRDNIVLHDGVLVAACSCVPQDVPAGTRISGVPAVESRQFLRENASLHRLPELVAEFARLLKRVEKLEAAADDQQDR